MKQILLPVFALLTLASCKKDLPAPTTKTVKYECNCTPLLGATLTGTITHTTLNSGLGTGMLTNNTWSYSQSGWNLKTGDRLTASATIQGNSNCTLYLYVDNVMKTFQNQAIQISGQNPTNSISVEYIVP
jgi:hypothetical protein